MPSSEPHEETADQEAKATAQAKATANETDTRPPEAATGAKADEPAWPPVEARPEEPAPGEPPSEAASAVAEAAPAEAILTKPEAPPAPEQPAAPKADEPNAEPELPAAEPKQEMGLSESTLHWLVDGEQPVDALPNDPGTAPHYDPSAPVPGRKRTVAVIGGAAILAFAVAALLHAQAGGHRADSAADANEPGEVVTQRAEAALAAGRSGDAMELARLAIAANPRLADAYVVIGKIERDSGRLGESRDAYRKYLDLAPIGTHAAEARAALATLPP